MITVDGTFIEEVKTKNSIQITIFLRGNRILDKHLITEESFKKLKDQMLNNDYKIKDAPEEIKIEISKYYSLIFFNANELNYISILVG